MSTPLLLFLLTVVVGIAALVLVLRSTTDGSKKARMPRAEQGSAKTRGPAKPKPANPFRAASISPAENACAAVMALGEKRFLVATGEVPTLPLPNCDAPKCDCTYVHHEDRRDNSELRRGPVSLRTTLHSHNEGTERRANKRGRRASDYE
ncbi:MAG: hypothetical protein R3E50_06295 [Halioglobus sp.]